MVGVAAQVELLALPAESLGHRSATWFTNSGGQPLPEPVLAPGTDGDDTWLHQRVRRTHDVWHVVSGCPPSPAGEAALSGINVCSCAGPAAPCCLALLAQRWKEGWQRPLAEWREQLGIAALVARNRDGNGKVLA
jgi:ubiquinone biosynthesis protein Coq4